MDQLSRRDVVYMHGGTRMSGLVCAPPDARSLPGIVLVHDAFGLGEEMIAIAQGLAALGFAVFAADMWGERRTPSSDSEIGPLIGGMVKDRESWMARVSAAHEVAGEQPEIDGESIVTLGYCFGGSSALEHVRTGGKVRAAISVHGGLDLIDFDWSSATATAHVLVCTGAEDPMATDGQRARLQRAMTDAGVDWQLHLYSGTKHAFTSARAQFSLQPEVVAYHPRNAQRAWDAVTRFLCELFPNLHPVQPAAFASASAR